VALWPPALRFPRWGEWVSAWERRARLPAPGCCRWICPQTAREDGPIAPIFRAGV